MAESPTFAGPVPPRPRGHQAAVILSDRSGTAMVLVRAHPDGDLAASLGAGMGASRVVDDVTICGQRPGAWALLGSPAAVGALASSLPLGGHAHLVDLTHGVALFRLSGLRSTAALEKVCALDWAEPMMPDGAVTSGSVALVLCDIVRQDEDGAPSYLLSCERSYGAYLFAAVLDAGAEFGIEVR